MISMLEIAIKEAIARQALGIKEEIVKAAVAEFERELRAAVGTVVVDSFKYYSIAREGTDLVIRVQIEEKKP